MAESWASLAARWYFNFFPAYRGTGARVTYISGTWNEIRIKLPLNWRTRNYVGTICGGSIYGVSVKRTRIDKFRKRADFVFSSFEEEVHQDADMDDS